MSQGFNQAAKRITQAGVISFGLFASLLTPVSAWAWGSEGHSIVAELAQRRLNPVAAQTVKQILGGDVSLASVASWADDVRVARPATYNLHFVQMKLAEVRFRAEADCAARQRGDCAVNAIARYLQQVKDTTLEAPLRREALKFLVHFVGDVHQPLHTVAELGGGNGIRVTFFLDPSRLAVGQTNLHHVWDTGIISAQYYAWGAYVEQLDTAWLPQQSPDKIKALQGGTPADWATEAHTYAREVAYPVASGQVLGLDYLKKVIPVVDHQLAAAGLRLAALLNDALK